MWLARQLLCGENSSSFAGGAQCHLLEKELVWFSALELCSAPCQPQLHREVSEPFLPKAQETVPGTLWKPLGQEQNIQRQGLQWLSNEKQWEAMRSVPATLQTLGRLDSKQVQLEDPEQSRGYRMSQHSTENLGLNISASLTRCCQSSWWTPGHQGGFSTLSNGEQNCMKQLMQLTPQEIDRSCMK